MIDDEPHLLADELPKGKRSFKRALRRGLAYCVVGYITWCGFLWLFQDQIVFPRNLAPRPPAGVPYRGAEEMKLDIGDGTTVHAWFAPAPGASAQHPAPMVVYCHGNAEIVEVQHRTVEMYRRMGVSVLLPEYRGYGRDGGKPSQEAIRKDALKFIETAANRPDVDRARVILHGRSLGGGVACDICRIFKPAAMILESTFVSVSGLAWRYGVPPLVVRNPFNNGEALSQYTGPLLIFHGTRDDILPVANGRRLHELNPRARYVEYDAMHNDFPGRGNEEGFERDIRDFLAANGLIAAP
ncbi:MAG: alpha/beta hydrolase [Planctomycetes bacterium]|nr:alpha/beta hydrolase [Planctomycetota bacterium]